MNEVALSEADATFIFDPLIDRQAHNLKVNTRTRKPRSGILDERNQTPETRLRGGFLVCCVSWRMSIPVQAKSFATAKLISIL